MASVKKEIDKMELDLSQVTRTKSILNQNQIQKLWNSTKDRYKYSRPAKGGGTWVYVKGSYVRKVLDSVFGFDWDFDIDTSVGEAFTVAAKTGGITLKGILTCRVVDDSGRIREIKKVQFGRAEIKWKKGQDPDSKPDNPRPLDFGNDMKAAATDAFKKCASLMGVAQDVYEADEFIDILIVDSDESKEKGVNRQLKNAQKALEQQSQEVDSEPTNAKN